MSELLARALAAVTFENKCALYLDFLSSWLTAHQKFRIIYLKSLRVAKAKADLSFLLQKWHSLDREKLNYNSLSLCPVVSWSIPVVSERLSELYFHGLDGGMKMDTNIRLG